MARRKANPPAQAWIELKADDPEALSTLDVARAHLPAGEGLESVRRLRLFELSGKLPAGDDLEELLHRSTQFYNPHKEKCTVRREAGDPAPVGEGEWVVLVVERGGDRRSAAERWWLHETGKRIEVREGIAWALRFRRTPEPAMVAGLVELRDRAHGLLCNPHSQDCATLHGEIPLSIWSAIPRAGETRGDSE